MSYINCPEKYNHIILVKRDNKLRKPLITHFGGISLKWNKWASISEQPVDCVWNNRTELVERLKAQEFELCGSHEKVEVHHIRKLADLKQRKATKAEWQKKMIARNRKTLIVCQKCHNSIHHGKYYGRRLSA